MSYNLLFITAIITGMLLLLFSAYYYDKFNKAQTQRLSKNDAENAKTMSMLGVMLGSIAIVIVIVYYFVAKSPPKPSF